MIRSVATIAVAATLLASPSAPAHAPTAQSYVDALSATAPMLAYYAVPGTVPDYVGPFAPEGQTVPELYRKAYEDCAQHGWSGLWVQWCRSAAYHYYGGTNLSIYHPNTEA